ncbi:hypothetical protein SUGI_0605470 [Cryptomeria japonica]|uniref:uncharacterized protein LOC131063497 n=1 Tax=Cryptomeria japonica TaxID=3369 RepID=UPI0024149D57|nr:uncharacterized protein LOC131063497 [Cryptomeria japonica]GLJ30576.1 hypothetical protein SUGI_0605470 [Cryptomeria japonica]
MSRKTPSIENEPRTLNEQELHSAREAAVDILQKKEPAEASDIFTQGLQPIQLVREMERRVQGQEQGITPLQCSNCQSVVRDVPPLHLHYCECECARNVRTPIEGPSSAPF